LPPPGLDTEAAMQFGHSSVEVGMGIDEVVD
jgi:hypothetical protein